MSSQDAIAAAIAKAKEIAAKMAIPSGATSTSFHPMTTSAPSITSTGQVVEMDPSRKRAMENRRDDDHPDDYRTSSYKRNVSDDHSSSRSRPGLGGGAHACTEDMFVPSSVVGLVIGRGGENLRRMEMETGAKIQVDHENKEQPQRRIILSAPSEANIERARRTIDELVRSKATDSRAMGTGAPNLSSQIPSGQTMQITIPNHRVGLIIGRGGDMIKELQEKSGAKIVVKPDTAMGPGSTERPVTITGESSRIEKAIQLIEEIVHSGPQKQNFNNRESGQRTTMPIPVEKVGALIGRGGETVRQLQQQSGAKIFLDQNAGNETERIVNIVGPPDAVTYAQQLISEHLNAFQGRRGPPAGAAPAPWTANNYYAQSYDGSAAEAYPSVGGQEYYSGYAPIPYPQDNPSSVKDTENPSNGNKEDGALAPVAYPSYDYYGYYGYDASQQYPTQDHQATGTTGTADPKTVDNKAYTKDTYPNYTYYNYDPRNYQLPPEEEHQLQKEEEADTVAN